MPKLRNIAFSAVALAVTLAVAANLAMIAIGDGTFDERSTLEGRAYQGIPALSVETIASGKFQSQSESFLADHVPKRAGIMIRNAEAQRAAICAAAAPFGFQVYPTKLSSSVIVDERARVVIDMPYGQQAYTAEAVDKAVNAWKAFIESHGDRTWCMAMVDRGFTTAASPAHDLMAETTDYAYFREALIGFLGDSCELPNLSYSSWDKFTNDYFKTDHHWQIMGAYSAYLEIMESLGHEPVAIRGFHVAYDGPFYGSAARSGLDDDYWDVVYDIDYDASDFTVKVNGKEKPRSVVDESLAEDYKGYSKPSKFANVYTDYFHTDWALLEFDNPSAPDGTLLVIADSYSNCIERLFAESYRHVSVIDPRHYEGDLDAYLEKLDPDDVLVLMGANNIFGKETLALLE